MAALFTAAVALAVAAPGAIAAPTVTITFPLNGTLTGERTPSFAGTSEGLSGAVTLHIYKGSPSEANLVQEQPTVTEPSGAWTTGPVETLGDGSYTATASQVNGGGETGISAPVAFTIDTEPPVVELDQPQPAPGEAAPVFNGTATDIEPVTVQIHAGASSKGAIVSTAIAAGTRAGWHSSPASPALPVGEYTAVAIQKSSLGNPAGRSTAMTFNVLPAPVPAAPGPPQSGVASIANVAHPKPALMAPFPVVRIAGISFGRGVKLRLLKVQQAPAGALIVVRCHGRGCPKGASRRITAAGPHGGVPAIVFGRFERYLRPGAVVEVLVSKNGVIGKYTRLRVRKGKLPERVDLCLDTSGLRAVACPAS